MSVDKVPMTVAGHKALEEELQRRKSVDRPSIIKAIAEARAHGDLSENAEYHAAKEAQGMNEAKVKELESYVSRAQVIDVSSMSGDTIKFGATIELADEDTDEEVTYQIVGAYEADASNGKVSISSPIARQMIGKEVGDSISVVLPKSSRSYEILKVSYK